MPSRTQVFTITDAQRGLTPDQEGRTKRYLFSMAIRTICFVGAVVTTGWLRWTLVAGAVVLPYLAVVLANAGKERTKDPETSMAWLNAPQQVALPSRSVDHHSD